MAMHRGLFGLLEPCNDDAIDAGLSTFVDEETEVPSLTGVVQLGRNLDHRLAKPPVPIQTECSLPCAHELGRNQNLPDLQIEIRKNLSARDLASAIHRDAFQMGPGTFVDMDDELDAAGLIVQLEDFRPHLGTVVTEMEEVSSNLVEILFPGGGDERAGTKPGPGPRSEQGRDL